MLRSAIGADIILIDNEPINKTYFPFSARVQQRDVYFDVNHIRMVDVHGNYRSIDLCDKCLKAFDSYLNTPSKYMKGIE